jgi:hypothetical protein
MRSNEDGSSGPQIYKMSAARVRGLTPQVGGGEDLLLALSEREDEPTDYERLCASAEAFVYAAMIGPMVRRLTRARGFMKQFRKGCSRKSEA